MPAIGRCVYATFLKLRKHSVNLFLTVLQVVAPVFLLSSVGFIWVKLAFEYRLQFVTRMTKAIAVPALIYTAHMS